MTEQHVSVAAGGVSGFFAWVIEAVSLDYAAILWGLAGGLFALARSEPGGDAAQGAAARSSRQAAVFLFLSALSAVALAEVLSQMGRHMLGDFVSATAVHRAVAFGIGFGAQTAAPRLLDGAVNAFNGFMGRVFGGGDKPRGDKP